MGLRSHFPNNFRSKEVPDYSERHQEIFVGYYSERFLLDSCIEIEIGWNW